jgi:hypothetical protein
VLEPHHAETLADLDGEEGGTDGAGAALGLGVADEVVDDEGDAVVEEGAAAEGVDVGFEQVAAGAAEGGGFMDAMASSRGSEAVILNLGSWSVW